MCETLRLRINYGGVGTTGGKQFCRIYKNVCRAHATTARRTHAVTRRFLLHNIREFKKKKAINALSPENANPRTACRGRRRDLQ